MKGTSKMKLPPFEKFLAEKEQSTLENILKNVPKGSPKNAQDFVHQATQMSMNMAVEYLRAYHEWLSKYLEDK